MAVAFYQRIGDIEVNAQPHQAVAADGERRARREGNRYRGLRERSVDRLHRGRVVGQRHVADDRSRIRVFKRERHAGVAALRDRVELLTPEANYELTGFVPGVCFPVGLLCDAATGRLAIYYGAADTFCALCFGKVDEIMDYVEANSDC